ncbi:MAG: GumC family protein [Paracoccaceae bacterium]
MPYFLLFVVIGSAIGVSLARILPPVYLAEARLVVESEQIPDNLAASTVRTEATEQLQIIQQRILTRDRLLEMANRLQIFALAPGVPSRPLAPDEIVNDLRERIKIVTTGGAGARGQATLVLVSFEAPTAAMSATVTNEVVTLILQENIAMRTSVAGQTLDFFTQEVERLDQELARQGAEILAFKTANQDALPDSLDFRRTQQSAAQERLLQLDREEAVLKDRRNRLVQIYDQTGQVEAGPAATQTDEERQLQALRDQMAQALSVLSPENPRVKMIAAQIESLEKVVAAQLSAAGPAPANPELSVYELQLADIDGQLQFIATQRAQIRANLDALRVSIEATPRNAIAIDTLERKYANTSVQYDLAIANRARAETGDVIEALAKGQRISIIEQAIAPREPESPNRPLIAFAGVAGGVAVGFGVVLLLEILNTAIRRPQDLTTRLGITPFATLPLMRTPGQLRRRRTIILATFALVVLAIPAGLWALDTFYRPLDLLIDQLLGRLGMAGLEGHSGPVAG